MAAHASANGLENLRHTPCTPSVCKGMGKSADEFLAKLTDLTKLFPDGTGANGVKNFEVFIAQLNKRSGDMDMKVSLNLARSVAGTIDIAVKAGKKVDGFEIRHGLGNRDYDLVLKIGEKLQHVETKSWERLDEAEGYLRKQVSKAEVNVKRTDGHTEPGQIVDDIINHINDKKAGNPPVLWAFSDPAMHAKRMDFAKLVNDEVKSNSLVQKIISARANLKPYDADEVEAVLKSIFGGVQ